MKNLAICLVLLGSAAIHAQQPAPKLPAQSAQPIPQPSTAPLVMTPVHQDTPAYLKLQLAIERAKNLQAQAEQFAVQAQKQLDGIQARIQAQVAEADKQATEVKTVEHWGADVKWNSQTGEFERATTASKPVSK